MEIQPEIGFSDFFIDLPISDNELIHFSFRK